ncbi:MAG: hypothetical protein A3H96_03270 [Acidobacteria bacterium RIFCSPLOWO2_02_FULL_67_36]|nr:MAG: hypothetical protein A3H96_03270 [Acidobacteria bacterium RIFCSPLOWO2_02_FULL_67_36]OFW25157.1 MAG: hypothetical protein A3G21_08950 [Acidobacteria bacterium RIFCSPLOWO2_12_FULL_66_21]
MKTTDSALSRLETHLGRLLVAGVAVSAASLSIGLGLYLASPGSNDSHLLLVGGLFVLMATPMVRVIVSFAEYVRMKDWFFMATTIVVLGVLAVSVLMAIRRL